MFCVRTATAFRWRPGSGDAEANDFVRTLSGDDARVIVLANSFESGFSTCWPPGSRFLLDCFERAFRQASGTVEERLRRAFAVAQEGFANESENLVPRDPEFIDETPTAVLLAVAYQEDHALAMWIGGDLAVHARGFSALGESEPHTLREEYRRKHPFRSFDVNQVPNVLLRTIGARSFDRAPPASARFALASADTLVLLAKGHYRGACVPLEDVAFAAGAFLSPTALAEHLADLAFENPDAPYASVGVLRFDAVDLATEVERLIDEYRPDEAQGDRLGEWARAVRALPVRFEGERVLALRPDGSVWSVDGSALRSDASMQDGEARQPHSLMREELHPGAHLAAVIAASRRYPSLEQLVPRRPDSATSCSRCAAGSNDTGSNDTGSNDTGSNQDDTSSSLDCPSCWGLGWELPPFPSWFETQSSAPSSRRGTSPSSRAKPVWWQRWLGRSPSG